MLILRKNQLGMRSASWSETDVSIEPDKLRVIPSAVPAMHPMSDSQILNKIPSFDWTNQQFNEKTKQMCTFWWKVHTHVLTMILQCFVYVLSWIIIGKSHNLNTLIWISNLIYISVILISFVCSNRSSVHCHAPIRQIKAFSHSALWTMQCHNSHSGYPLLHPYYPQCHYCHHHQ